MSLTPKAKQQFKAKAHRLKPIVLLGNKGLTEAVKKEIDLALKDHELIKIRLATTDREMKKASVAEICDSLNAQPIQLIGNICVLYRKNMIV